MTTPTSASQTAISGVPEFSFRNFAGYYQVNRIDPLFPARGIDVLQLLPKDAGFDYDTLDYHLYWTHRGAQEVWQEYLQKHVDLGVTDWFDRFEALDSIEPISDHAMRMAGLVQLDPKLVKAGHKRLFGHVPDKFDGWHLQLVAAALWNVNRPVFGFSSWAAAVNHLEWKKQREDDRQQKVHDLLRELD